MSSRWSEFPRPIVPGRIVWAVPPSQRGMGKVRPLIVATRRIDILKGNPIIVIACSAVFHEPLSPVEILLPFDQEGKGVTGLKADTIAVCDWIEAFPTGTKFKAGRMVPGPLLKTIFEAAGIKLPPER